MWTSTLFPWIFCPPILWFPFHLSELFILSLLCPPSNSGVPKSLVSLFASHSTDSPRMAPASPVTPATMVILRNSTYRSANHSPETMHICTMSLKSAYSLPTSLPPLLLFLGPCLGIWHHIRDLGVILDFDFSINPVSSQFCALLSTQLHPLLSPLSHDPCSGHCS